MAALMVMALASPANAKQAPLQTRSGTMFVEGHSAGPDAEATYQCTSRDPSKRWECTGVVVQQGGAPLEMTWDYGTKDDGTRWGRGTVGDQRVKWEVGLPLRSGEISMNSIGEIRIGHETTTFSTFLRITYRWWRGDGISVNCGFGASTWCWGPAAPELFPMLIAR